MPAGPVPGWQWLLEAFPGVPIFFVISGFLISLSYERSGDLGIYAQNRVLRIYPGLWACFVVSVVSVAIFDPAMLHVSPGRLATWTLGQVTVGQFYNPPWLRSYGVGVLNGSLWTIPVELQFYAVLPLIYGSLGLGKRKGNGGLIALLALFWAVNQGFVRLGPVHDAALWYKLWGVTFVPYIYLFIGGILLQRNWTVVSRWLAGRAWVWLAAYLLSAIALHGAGLTVGTNLPNPVAVPLLVAAVFSAAFSAPTLTDRLLRRNDISYGVYIYHMPVMNAFLVAGVALSGLAIWSALGVTVLLATLSWVVVERPALRRKRRTLHALPAA